MGWTSRPVSGTEWCIESTKVQPDNGNLVMEPIAYLADAELGLAFQNET